MPTKCGHAGWITCPCEDDPAWDGASAQFTMSSLEKLDNTAMQVVLARQPRIGTVLTVEFFRAAKAFSTPFKARVTRVSKHPQNGWIVDCEFDPKFSDEELKIATAMPTMS
jgi:hypothetical protein